MCASKQIVLKQYDESLQIKCFPKVFFVSFLKSSLPFTKKSAYFKKTGGLLALWFQWPLLTKRKHVFKNHIIPFSFSRTAICSCNSLAFSPARMAKSLPLEA